MQESYRPTRTRVYNQPVRCEDRKDALTKRFLLQDEENGIDELEVLEIVVDNVIEF